MLNRVHLAMSVFAFWATYPALAVPPHSMVHNKRAGHFRLSYTFGDWPPWMYLNESKTGYTGLLPDVLDLLCEELNMSFSLRAHQVNEEMACPELSQNCTDYAQYVEFLNNVTDAIITPSTAMADGYGYNRTIWPFPMTTAEAYRVFQKNMPQAPVTVLFTDHFGAMLRKRATPPGTWELFSPFAPDLWAAVVIIICTSGFLIAILDLLAKVRTDESWMKKTPVEVAFLVLKAQYHAFGALLGGEDYEWVTWSGRLLRHTLLFVVLILVASYTANLAAFFTRPSEEVIGPQDMAGLRNAVAYADGNFAYRNMIKGFVKKAEWAYPTHIKEYDRVHKIPEWLIARLLSSEADVVVGQALLLNTWIQNNCNELVLADNINFGEETVNLMFRPGDGRLASDMRAGLAWLKTQPRYQALFEKHLNSGYACGGSQGSGEDLAVLDFNSQRGLCYIAIFGMSSALLVGIAECMFFRPSARHSSAQTGSGTEEMTDEQLIRALQHRLALRPFVAAEPNSVAIRAAAEEARAQSEAKEETRNTGQPAVFVS